MDILALDILLTRLYAAGWRWYLLVLEDDERAPCVCTVLRAGSSMAGNGSGATPEAALQAALRQACQRGEQGDG